MAPVSPILKIFFSTDIMSDRKMLSLARQDNGADLLIAYCPIESVIHFFSQQIALGIQVTRSDSFAYTVADPAGNQLTGQTFAITVTAVDDDAPTVVNQATTVLEGATNVALGLGDLQSTDPDTDDTTLIYNGCTTLPYQSTFKWAPLN